MKLTLIAAALTLAASAALAQGYGYGPRGGYGPGYGMGPGMGPGMGYGPGGGRPAAGLSAEQREKVAAIHDEARLEHWNTREQMRAEMFKLRQMDADSPAHAEQLKKVAELREQMFKQREETRRRVDAVLK